MNDIKNKKTQELFSKIKLESPSLGFENTLMRRIGAQHLLEERRSNRRFFWATLAGVALISAVFVGLCIYMGFSIHSFFSFDNLSMQITPSFISLSIPIVCFILLVLDSSIRSRLRAKEEDKIRNRNS